MTARLLDAIDQFSSKRVLVLGDAMLDSYVVGSSTRLCQEAPVPVVAVRDRIDCPGGAANTAVNLAKLGCQVEFLSVVGADHENHRLRNLLARHGVDTGLLTISEARQTLSKQRIVNGGQLLARIDQGCTDPVSPPVERQLLERLDEAVVRADAVVISDYGYGVMTAGLLSRLRTLQQRYRQLIAVDARDLVRYRTVGVAVVKPNFAEAVRVAGARAEQRGQSRVEIALALGEIVLNRTAARIAAITLDVDGAVVVERGRHPHQTRAQPVDQARTAGAGDTYLAALTLALASGATTQEAAELAACAASIVVSRSGTAACTASELRRAAGVGLGPWAVPESPTVTHEGPADQNSFGERDGRDGPTDVGKRRAPALHQA
jgi:D-beta-D-heptose 7-phosphate kinase/D-beta-D-heptose 1-phosphate adenosyltransferase